MCATSLHPPTQVAIERLHDQRAIGDGALSFRCRHFVALMGRLGGVSVVNRPKPYTFVENVVGHLDLSPRQRQITLMLVAGQNSVSIMERLEIRLGTLRTHKRIIFSKLGVHSQVELVARIHAKALEEALLPSEGATPLPNQSDLSGPSISVRVHP